MAWNCTQLQFRGRNDDGSETTATWIAAADTDWTQDVDVNFRVRFEIDFGDTGSDFSSLFGQIQYNLNSGGWNNVTASSSVVIASASSHFFDGSLTTQQIGSGTYFAGYMEEVDGLAPTGSYLGNEFTENEYCLQIVSGDVADTDTIELRLVGQGSAGTVFDTYTSIPSITVNEGGGGADTLSHPTKNFIHNLVR